MKKLTIFLSSLYCLFGIYRNDNETCCKTIGMIIKLVAECTRIHKHIQAESPKFAHLKLDKHFRIHSSEKNVSTGIQCFEEVQTVQSRRVATTVCTLVTCTTRKYEELSRKTQKVTTRMYCLYVYLWQMKAICLHRALDLALIT